MRGVVTSDSDASPAEGVNRRDLLGLVRVKLIILYPPVPGRVPYTVGGRSTEVFTYMKMAALI